MNYSLMDSISKRKRAKALIELRTAMITGTVTMKQINAYFKAIKYKPQLS